MELQPEQFNSLVREAMRNAHEYARIVARDAATKLGMDFISDGGRSYAYLDFFKAQLELAVRLHPESEQDDAMDRKQEALRCLERYTAELKDFAIGKCRMNRSYEALYNAVRSLVPGKEPALVY